MFSKNLKPFFRLISARNLNEITPITEFEVSLTQSKKPMYWSKDPYDIRKIFCEGSLLHAVQMAHLHPDSKAFVDMKLKSTVPRILSEWSVLEKKAGGKPIHKHIIRKFVEDHFETADNLEPWVPPDWVPNPPFFDKIKSDEYRQFAVDLHKVWLRLARKMGKDSLEDLQKSSLIYVPNGLIIPGGRFKELYYWDTLWIIKGLLVCDMVECAKGMIDNMIYLLKNYGHIYNGARIYYQFRSQPPLLLEMVNAYVQYTQDFSYVDLHFELFEKEMSFWENTRKLQVYKDGAIYHLFRYICRNPGPRPESYREDYEAGEKEKDEEMKFFRYRAIASGAESGMDFSSRWFWQKEGDTMDNIHTQLLFPVCLNAFMHKNYKNMRNWSLKLNRMSTYEKYRFRALELRNAIDNVLWDEVEGIWYDVEVTTGKKRKDFVITNFVPTWSMSFSIERKAEVAEKVLNYYNRYGLWKYPGGVPITLNDSGEQWDWPNAWAPSQAFMEEGFRNVGLPFIGYTIAHRWVNSAYKAFKRDGVIYEKYDVRKEGYTGFGGEYEEQDGFGFSNGLVFEFLKQYPNDLRPNP